MKFITYIIGNLLLISCLSAPMKNVKESIALEEIVYLQTQGLLILNKILSSPHCEETNMICEKIKLFYANSQHHLHGLCETRELNLTMGTYSKVNDDIENLIHDSTYNYDFLVEKLLENLYEQKKFYLQVIEDRELASLHFYALDSYLQMMCFVDDIEFMTLETYTAQ